MNSQRGFAQVLVLLLLLGGLAAGVYLVQQKTNFLPKASEPKSKIPSQKLNKGYIVEFKNKSVAEYKKDLTEAGKAETEVGISIENYRHSIQEEHKKAKEDILSKLGKKVFNAPPGLATRDSVKLLREYENVFNGLVLDINKSQAEKLKDSEFIKSVYTNIRVKSTLMDSVPMINADDVWKMQDNKDRNITGKGVKIGVIDTGVDYTNSELGGTQINERSFEKITPDPINLFFGDYPESNETDEIIRFNNNSLIYSSDNKIIIYSFATKTYTEITTPSSDLRVVRLAFDDNYIAYYAVDSYLNAYVYLYDRNTQKHIRIAQDFQDIGGINITNGKVIYEKNVKTKENIYVYDINTGVTVHPPFPYPESVFIDMPKASGNLLAFSQAGQQCYDNAIVYDLNSGQIKKIYPPDIGPILDLKGNTLLYVACSKTDFDPKWSTYYLYDLQTGAYEKLKYPSGSEMKQPNNTQNNYINVVGNINKGAIGDGVIFFSKDLDANRIIAYDQTQKRYVEVNLLPTSGTFTAEGKKVCFVSVGSEIYCHDYDPTFNYPPPPQNIFNSKVVDGFNFISNNYDPYDDSGHGTHVSAIAAGSGALKGVAPDSQLVEYKVLDNYGNGYASDIIAALDMAVMTKIDSDSTNDINVVNLSLGADCYLYDNSCGPDDPMSKAVDNAVNVGIVAAVAAGNSGPSKGTINSPGTSREAITVGAVDKNSIIADFSSRGPIIWGTEKIKKPDIVAPGVSICAAEWDGFSRTSRCLDDKHIYLTGTSMATPHVAGAVSLLKQMYPNKSSLQIKTRIKYGAKNLSYDINTQGSGLLDVLKSILPSPALTP